MMDSPREQAEQAADPRVDLAVKRTELAWDRTLLAWLRTTTALIAAGAAFDKGAQWLHEARLAAGTAFIRNGHLVGLSLTSASTVLLLFVCWQYWGDARELTAIKGSRPARVPSASIACRLVIFLGAAVFFLLLNDTR
jgi:putative membrane protein